MSVPFWPRGTSAPRPNRGPSPPASALRAESRSPSRGAEGRPRRSWKQQEVKSNSTSCLVPQSGGTPLYPEGATTRVRGQLSQDTALLPVPGSPAPSLGKAATPGQLPHRNPPHFCSTRGGGVRGGGREGRWRHTTGKKQSKPQRAEGQRAPDAPCPEGHTGNQTATFRASMWSQGRASSREQSSQERREPEEACQSLVRQTANQQAAS